MDEVMSILGRKEPREAASVIARAAKELLPLLSEGEQREFIEQMIGDSGDDKVIGMVHL